MRRRHLDQLSQRRAANHRIIKKFEVVPVAATLSHADDRIREDFHHR
jgi:hypothetical protein